MAKNQVLLNLLQALALSETPETALEQKQVLDELIQADLTEASNFRRVVLNHRDVFSDDGDLYADAADNDGFLAPSGEGDEAGANNLRALQRVAAEKRVEFGIMGMSLKEVISLVKSTDIEDFRTKLATNSEHFGDLSASFGWQDVDGNPGLVSDDAFQRIKKGLMMGILLRSIEANHRYVLNLMPDGDDALDLEEAEGSITKITDYLAEMTEAYDASEAIDPSQEALQEAHDKVQEVRLNLAFLKSRYFIGVVEQHTTEIDKLKNEINASVLIDEAQYKKLGLAQALLRDAEDKYQSLLGLNLGDLVSEEHVAAIEAQKVGTLEKLEQARIDFKLIQIMLKKDNELDDAGQIYFQEGLVMDLFTDELVKAGETPKGAPLGKKPTGVVVDIGHEDVVYNKVKLGAGDQIFSTATFQFVSEKGTTSDTKVILAQDSTGKVVDLTEGPLNGVDQCRVALRQAEMILNSYEKKPGDNRAIVIKGSAHNPVQANRVLAALLLLKQARPELKDLKIESQVMGCDVPTSGYFTSQTKAEQQLIETYLPAKYMKKECDSVKDRYSGFSTEKKPRIARFNELKLALKAAGAGERLREAEGLVNEDDKITVRPK